MDCAMNAVWLMQYLGMLSCSAFAEPAFDAMLKQTKLSKTLTSLCMQAQFPEFEAIV